MEEFKSAIASKTIWGGLIAILASVASLFGYQVMPEAQSAVVDLAATVGSAVGGVIAIYGRVTATQKIRNK